MGFEIIYLMVQNHRLKGIIQDPKKYFKTLTTDQNVPSFAAQDINGNDVSLRYSPTESHTMIFWFAPTCPSCEDNIAFWKLIYTEYSSENLKFLGMYVGNPGEAREFVSENSVEFPVVCATNRYIVDSYKGHVLPQTMLITPEGTIHGVWPGILDEKKQNEIIAALETLNP
ncbi:MAG: redoxin domain-containing protein [Candidatus Latescibacteria bacterium]|nr:redoxin domain-containing protein [Candidatus Latescibacterota bacterium]NIO56880.1 redoxin domain-containing protein [Candidatus Latescibacterota bacterium]